MSKPHSSGSVGRQRYTRRLAVSLIWLAVGVSGCSYFRSGEPLAETVDRIAVLPIRRAPGVDNQKVVPGAERTITAHIYGIFAAAPEWNFVPDLTVTQALTRLPREDDVVEQARGLGKVVKADAVLCGVVSRYIERDGSEYGTRKAAAVGIELQLVSVATGKVLWQGSFDQQQKALSENLFNWWQFWSGGVRWFTAEELSRLAIEHLLEDLKRAYLG